MARQTITVQTAVQAGIEPVYAAAHVDGHMFLDGDHLELFVKNGNAGSCVVTFKGYRSNLGLTAQDYTVTVPTTKERRIAIGDVLRQLCKRNEGVTDPNMIYVDYSVQSSVTVALQSR